MASPQDLPYILPKDCDFTAIQAHDEDCRPKLVGKSKFEFVGIIINGPGEVIWPRGAERDSNPSPTGITRGPVRLVMPTLFRLPENTLNLDGDFYHEILYVAVNQSTNKVFKGKLRRGPMLPPMRIDGIKNDPKKMRGGALNPDIVNVCSLPVENATYIVYATLASHKSNVLTIKTAVK